MNYLVLGFVEEEYLVVVLRMLVQKT